MGRILRIGNAKGFGEILAPCGLTGTKGCDGCVTWIRAGGSVSRLGEYLCSMVHRRAIAVVGCDECRDATHLDSCLVKPAWMVLESLIRSARGRVACYLWGTLTLSVLLMGSHVGPAQEPDVDSPTPKVGGTRDLPNILNEGTIDTTARLYLDDNGKPILVPAESYETFLKSKSEQSAQRNALNQLPSFVFDQSDVDILVSGVQAKLAGTFQVSLSTSTPSAVSIPLRFGSCQLTEVPQFTGGGENLIEVRSGSAGYQWHLQASPGSKHTAILKGGAVVNRQGERSELKVGLPNSPCTVVVTLPLNAVDEKVSGEGNEFFDREAGKDSVVLRIRASGGELSISWRDTDLRNRVSAVEAASATRLEIEEPRQVWKARTDLTLRWFGADATDTIVLNLPLGARWVQLPAALSENYSITDFTVTTNATQDPNPQAIAAAHRLKIRNLDPSLMQPIELRLEWEWEPSPQSDDSFDKPIQIPSIVIEGADSHTGTVELVMPTSYMPTWREEPGTKLVQQSRPVDLFDRSQYLFRFIRQPLQLTARFRRPSKLASIRPTYLAHIDGNKMKLTVWLDCTFDLSQPMAISILPADWIIDSAEVVDMAAPHASGEPLDLQPQLDGSYSLSNVNVEQLELNTQRRTRQTWRMIAFRPLEHKENNGVSFRLPQMMSGSIDSADAHYEHGTGILIVTSSDNLLLKNLAPLTKGLLVDSLVPQWQPLLGSNEVKQTLVYRFQSRGDVPLWSGTADPLPQQIVLKQQAELTVGVGSVRIGQNFDLQVANEPLSPLRFAIRQDALEYLLPQLTIDDAPAELRRINTLEESLDAEAGTSQNASAIGWQIFESMSVTPLRGAIKLKVISGVPWTAQNSPQLTQIHIPLVQLLVPRETRVLEQSWSVRADRETEVFESLPPSTSTLPVVQPADSNNPDGDVQVPDKPNVDTPQMIAALAEPRELNAGQAEVVLSARKLESLAPMPVRIGRSWLQTIVNGSERRDRYCAQLESTLPRLSIRIPSSRNLNHVFVNGQRVKFTGEGTQFQVELPNNNRRQYQLEIWMTSSESLAWVTSLDINIPEIDGAQFFDRFYWQLAVPSIQHMGFASAPMTPEWIWKWNGCWWSRESGMKQSDLERWVGATQQTDLPLSVNGYLLSTFGGGRSFQIWVLSRFMMWLPIGLVAILVSILLISFRLLRHPAFLLLAAGGLATAGMLAPDLAVLLGQTAMISLGLVSLVLITQAAIESRVRRRSVFTVRPSHYTERSDHFSLARNVKMSSPSSTRAQSPVIADGGE